MPRRGYYDEEGYWHKDPDLIEEEPPRIKRRRRPIRDPYYDNYRDRDFDTYGRRVVIRRTPVRQPRYRKITTSELGMFSYLEIRDLAISTLVLAVAFTLVLGHDFLLLDPIGVFITIFPLSLIATVTAFSAHEMAHKFMAQKHGLPAEFVLYPTGILLALGTALLLGFLFALPGAVVFSGSGADRRIVGKVGAAGPAMNILIAAVLLPLWFFIDLFGWLQLVIFVNVFLGGFNMIPWGMFDGLKVWRWSPLIYFGMLGILILMAIPIIRTMFSI